jgi:hypothetical protein
LRYCRGRRCITNCQTCRSAVIIEYESKLDSIAFYDLDPYYVNNQKVFHVHSVDERTRKIALEMFAAEKRLLHDAYPNDYYYRRK